MVLKTIIENMLKLEKVLFRNCMNSNFHEIFEDDKCISRLKSLHESCSAMSLENFDTNLTFIGSIKREL